MPGDFSTGLLLNCRHRQNGGQDRPQLISPQFACFHTRSIAEKALEDSLARMWPKRAYRPMAEQFTRQADLRPASRTNGKTASQNRPAAPLHSAGPFLNLPRSERALRK